MSQPECRDARGCPALPYRLPNGVAYLPGSHAAVAAHGMPANHPLGPRPFRSMPQAPSKSFYSVPGARREATEESAPTRAAARVPASQAQQSAVEWLRRWV